MSIKGMEEHAKRQSRAMVILNLMESLHYSLHQDKKDGLWYVVGVNQTGGWEFRTWWGQDDEIKAVNQFQATFPFPVWDNIAMEEYPYRENEAGTNV